MKNTKMLTVSVLVRMRVQRCLLTTDAHAHHVDVVSVIQIDLLYGDKQKGRDPNIAQVQVQATQQRGRRSLVKLHNGSTTEAAYSCFTKRSKPSSI